MKTGHPNPEDRPSLAPRESTRPLAAKPAKVRLGAVKLEGVAALLEILGKTQQERGAQYEQLRSKLIFFFMRRSLQFPEDLADESLDRLARRVSEGIEVASLPAFAIGIARYVAQEQVGRKNRIETKEDSFWDNVPAHSVTPSDEQEIAGKDLARMEWCLKKLPSEDAKLIRAYYLAEQPRPLDARKKMAERLGISANTLRQRVFLARERLRECLMIIEREPSLKETLFRKYRGHR